MKRNYYFLLLAALVCCLSLSVTSCKSDDDNNSDDEDVVFTDGPQDEDETAAKFWNVVGELVEFQAGTTPHIVSAFSLTCHIRLWCLIPTITSGRTLPTATATTMVTYLR